MSSSQKLQPVQKQVRGARFKFCYQKQHTVTKALAPVVPCLLFTSLIASLSNNNKMPKKNLCQNDWSLTNGAAILPADVS